MQWYGLGVSGGGQVLWREHQAMKSYQYLGTNLGKGTRADEEGNENANCSGRDQAKELFSGGKR